MTDDPPEPLRRLADRAVGESVECGVVKGLLRLAVGETRRFVPDAVRDAEPPLPECAAGVMVRTDGPGQHAGPGSSAPASSRHRGRRSSCLPSRAD